jgi:hypothetical protein
MLSYTAYGLNIRSDLLLPELLSAEGEPDVVIRLGKVDSPLPADEEGLIHATEGKAFLFFRDLGKVLVREGREIIIDLVPGANDSVLRLVILGPGIGAILYQRGQLTLHASAVAVEGEAIAFMAERGWGKSTTAAAMHSRGYWLVSDDIAALRFEDAGDVPMMVPGYPQFKLWPEAAALLGDVPEELPRLNPDLEKRGRPVSTAFASAPLPLKRIYLLDQGEVPEIEPLSPQESFSSLLHHTYGRLLFQAVRTSSHFLQCARVVKSVPIRRLRRPYSLGVLPEVARLIEEDLERNP